MNSKPKSNHFSFTTFFFTSLKRLLHCTSETDSPTVISFRRFLFFSRNIDTNEFFPSNDTGTRSTTVDEENHLFSSLKTTYQLATARSILHEWNRTSTLATLPCEWSSRHENQPSERNSFSLLLDNISSPRLRLEDLINYVSECYPSIWALTRLHFNDEVNHQLASYFKAQYTIYY